MIRPEHVGGLCLLITLDTARSLWSIGLLRVTPDVLTQGGNRDGKQTLSTAGRRAITWIHRDVPLPASVLTRLTHDEVAAILSDPSGQRRVNHLFRTAQRRPVHRTDVTTVARQPDGSKRVRDARPALAPDGIVVLGGLSAHRQVARDLGLPVPGKDTWVSARLVPAEVSSAGRTTDLDGTRWRLVLPDDPHTPLDPPAPVPTR